jgi:hypothetical protein
MLTLARLPGVSVRVVTVNMPPDAADGLQVPVREDQLTECAAGDAGEAACKARHRLCYTLSELKHITGTALTKAHEQASCL